MKDIVIHSQLTINANALTNLRTLKYCIAHDVKFQGIPSKQDLAKALHSTGCIVDFKLGNKYRAAKYFHPLQQR
ncbi:MAG: hypothetical protein LBI69_00660 [Puniceicoccales bacterium]|nr:hypothetical protein [Puniceicoccales bacterium]